MPRYINADNIHYTRLLSQQGLDMELVPKAVIDNMPTVDAVEVVRCRDCLNAMKMPESVREYFGYREDALDCGVGGGVMLPDDYCSKGCKMIVWLPNENDKRII